MSALRNSTEQAEQTAPGIPPAGPASPPRPRTQWVAWLGLHRFSGFYVWAVIIAVFAIWDPSVFLTLSNLQIIASEQAITAMIALAMLIPLACGEFDLSVAQLMGFSAINCAWMQFQLHYPAGLAIVITLVIGLLVGCTNAFLVVRLGISSFIATLGMTSILDALGYWLTGSQDVASGVSPSLISFGNLEVLGISSGVWALAIIALIMWFVLQRVPAGRYLYATGDNAQAARLTGIRTNRVVASSFITSALLAAIIGVIYLSQVGVASLTAGPPYLLPALSAVFLGATQITPGRFNVLGTVVAVYVLATGVKGLQLTVAAPWANELFTGCALIVAVGLSRRGLVRMMQRT